MTARGLFIVTLVLLFCLGLAGQSRGDPNDIPSTALVPVKLQAPSLVVVISVDQLRRDRLNASLPGGLGRLIREGRLFADASLNHGITNTCPGHVVMLTGVNPARAGVVGNDFVDRKAWAQRYCVDDLRKEAGVPGADYGRSPRNINVTSLGDWIKAKQPAAKVFSVSAKDRSAIAMGGQQPDAVYWFDRKQSRFVSSKYYMSELPGWVHHFNSPQGFLSRIPAQWEHPVNGVRPDDYGFEDDAHGRESGHPLNTGEVSEKGQQIYESPWADNAVMALARELVLKENLGRRESTDLLAISLSAIDTVGHLYGPFSSESEDTLNNLDRLLGDWLAFLEAHLGDRKPLVVLSADHGVLALPEWKKETGEGTCPYEDGRADLLSLYIGMMSRIYFGFTAPFSHPENLVRFAGIQIYVNRKWAKENEVDPDVALADVEAYLESQPYIREVWNMDELYVSEKSLSEEARLFRNSHNPAQGGDLILQAQEGCLIRGAYGTDHLSIYDYDRDIPLLFWGEGVQAGIIQGRAHSVDIAPTLASFLNVPPPSHELEGRVLDLSLTGSRSVAE